MDVLVVRSVAHWEEAGLKCCGPAHIFHTLPVEMPWESAWTLNGTRSLNNAHSLLIASLAILAACDPPPSTTEEEAKPANELSSAKYNKISEALNAAVAFFMCLTELPRLRASSKSLLVPMPISEGHQMSGKMEMSTRT